MTPLRTIALKLLKGEVVLSSDELAAERLKVCEECLHFKRLLRQCEICHCFMDAKAKLLDVECPIKEW